MMSVYSSDQRCPRCHYFLTPGTTVCPNCGLVLAGAAPGGNPLYPLPSGQPASGGSGAYGASNQPPTIYSPQGTPENAPTVAGTLYPQESGAPGSGYSGGYSGSQPAGAYPPATPSYPGSQPQGGYPGSAPSYSSSQPPAVYPGSAPAYPGSQPPGGFGPPPLVMIPGQTPPKQGGNKGLRIAIIILVVLVVFGGGGTALAYFLTRPKPLIDVTSKYPQNCVSPNPTGGTATGATGTQFHVTGQKFSGSSAITFLLDGQPAPGVQTVQSDAKGNVTADLTVTDDWQAGNHTITARDADGYKTDAGQTIIIVEPGAAGTPGPNSAPPDCQSFTMSLQVQPTDALTGDQLKGFSVTLQVTGQQDPAGGTVCQDRDDNQPHNFTGSDSNGVGFTETIIFKCEGTYKNGKFTYKETATSDSYAFDDGFSCTASGPYVYEQYDGSFTSSTEVSGDYSGDAATYNCSSGAPQTLDPEKGTFTGTGS